MDRPPQRDGVSSRLPLSQRLRVEKVACFGCGFWFCSGFGCFWSGGGGFVPILSSCTFCSAALQYCIDARKGGEMPLSLPK